MILNTGDLHGTDGLKRKFEKIKNLDLTYDDYIIVDGDFGIIWHDFDKVHYLDKNQEGLKWLLKNVKCRVLFIDGNHENFNRLNEYPISEWNGGKVHHINEQVIHLIRGQVFTIDGITIFTIGGARSTDKAYRTVNKSWWAAEEPTMEELEEYRLTFEANIDKIEYIISHETLAMAYPFVGVIEFMKKPSEYFLPYWLDAIYTSIAGKEQFKKFIFGHMHEDKAIGSQIRAIYEDIIELV